MEKEQRGSSREGSNAGLTVVSVIFDNQSFLRRNLDLVGRLNPDTPVRWLLVDNSVKPGEWDELPGSIELMRGTQPTPGSDEGSRHHAEGLELALPKVTSRFLLFLDPDFFVVYKNWIPALLRHMEQRGLGIFGAVWHPRWYFQYRYFPSVHFMLIDTARIPVGSLDLKPRIDEDRWWQWINDDRVPIPGFLRHALKATRIRDTGWAVYRRYRSDPAVKRETLVPHFIPGSACRLRLERLLPENWCTYPGNRSAYTSKSFLQTSHGKAYEVGWEEFFWENEPFAVHLRRVGRSWTGGKTEDDLALLDDFLARLEASTR